MGDNFYSILEISENANSEEIKKSYRRLSLKFHPDKNLNNPDAVSKFQKITEAYETLSDREKRQSYDMMRKNPFAKMESSGLGTTSWGQRSDPLEELLSNFFGASFGHGNHFNQPSFGSENPFGQPGPFSPNVQIFKNGVPFNLNQSLQKPTPIIKTINITMDQVLTGYKLPIDIQRWIVEDGIKKFENETLYVDIPKGVDDNEIIILREKGNIISDICKGDIKLFIKIINNSDLKRNGLDLVLEKKITLKEALCGFSFDLKYVNGKSYTINNTGGNIIPPGHRKIIQNMGLTRDNHIGNLIIIFDIEFPTKLNDAVITILRDIL